MQYSHKKPPEKIRQVPGCIRKTIPSQGFTRIITIDCKEIGGGGVYPREMGTMKPFVLLAFFSCLIVFVRFKIGHSSFKTLCFGELAKAIFRPEKDKWWIRGPKTPKPPEMPLKQGKTSQHHHWPRYMDWPQIGPRIAIYIYICIYMYSSHIYTGCFLK